MNFKTQRLLALTLLLSFNAYSAISTSYESAAIKSIDNYSSLSTNFTASEKALPASFHKILVNQQARFGFTVKTEAEIDDLFQELIKDPRAREQHPGGNCAIRRDYIQEKLEDMGIASGQFFIKCNFNRGNLRLQDRVSMSNFTYSNFHDVNVMAVKTEQGIDYRVLDVQFEDGPVSLSEYIGEVESVQSIKPLTGGGLSNRNPKVCFWSMNSDVFSSRDIK